MKTYQIKEKKQNRITLLRHVPLPNENDLKEVSVSLEFDEVVMPEDLKVKNKSTERDEQGRIKHFEFKNTPFQVKYRLIGGYDPANDVDIAGNPCNEKKEKAENAAANDEKEAWLDHARSERESLKQSENGRILLQAYDTYTDVYDVAVKTQTFRREWVDPAVKEMSSDTHVALSDDNTEINTKTYKVRRKSEAVLYNDEAFFMESVLTMALCAMKTHDGQPSGLNQPGPNYIDDETIDQSLEAMSDFTNGVKSTGNSEGEPPVPMTRKDVYDAINNTDVNTLPSENHTQRILEEMNYYRERMENEQKGLVSSEEDKYGREAFYRELMREKELRGIGGKILYEGTFSGVIPDDGFEVDVRMKEENGKLSDIVISHINIPDCDFDVDSENWDKTYREALEEQFKEVSFVSRSLINMLQEGVGQIVRKEVAKYESIII